MNETSNPFALSPEKVAAWQAGQSRSTNGTKGSKPPAQASKRDFVQFHYQPLLALAKETRDPLLAVLAILHNSQFKNWDKTKQIVFGNAAMRSLGFYRSDKVRALKDLESAGWIAVQWRERKSPLVTLIKGFKF